MGKRMTFEACADLAVGRLAVPGGYVWTVYVEGGSLWHARRGEMRTFSSQAAALRAGRAARSAAPSGSI